MTRTVFGLCDDLAEAEAAVDELLTAGLSRDAVSLVTRDERTGELRDGTPDVTDGVEAAAAQAAGTGATAGTLLGGTLGLLAGLGALAIPGVGPVIAAGTLASALGSAALGAGLGAAAGGLVGGLTGLGVPPSDLQYYTEGVRQGGVLVGATVTGDDQIRAAESILHRNDRGRMVADRITAASQVANNIDEVPINAAVGADTGDNTTGDDLPPPERDPAAVEAQKNRRLV